MCSWSTVVPKRKPPGFWQNRENVISFVEFVKDKLNVRSPEDWPNINVGQISKSFGARGLRTYFTSTKELVTYCYPSFDWDTVKWKHLTNNYWTMERRQRFLNKIKEEFQIHHQQDWKKVLWKDITQRGGSGLQHKYESIYNLLCDTFPEEPFDIFEVSSILPNKFWDDQKNVYSFLERVKQKCNIKDPSDWEKVNFQQICELGGRSLYKQEKKLHLILEKYYPEEDWEFIRKRKPNSHWNNPENLKDELEEIGKKLGVQALSDWDKITTPRFVQCGGAKLMKKGYSFFDLLSTAYPTHNWNVYLRRQLPFSFWKDKKNRVEFIEQFAKANGITKPEDWSKISLSYFRNHGGRGIMKYYPSFYELLKDCYPNEDWSVHKVRKAVPKNYWKNNDEKAMIRHIEEVCKITKTADWYRVSLEQIRHTGCLTYVKRTGLKNILKRVYPEVPWKEQLFSTRLKRSSQRWLFVQVQELFGNEEIVEDYYLSTGKDEITQHHKVAIQFDIFLPRIKVAFEYQGAHHYSENPQFGGFLELYQQRDKEKIEIAKRENIKLLLIPYWWDGEINSLKTFIKTQEPNLLES